MVYAKKGTLKTQYSDMVWKAMGTNKNGWVEVTKAQYTGDAPVAKSGGTKPAGLDNEAAYLKVYNQGKGLEKDGKLVEAKAKFVAALALKSTPNLKGKITKLTNLIEAAAKAALGKDDAQKAYNNRRELIDMADTALAANDLETALESYQAAQEIKATSATQKKIDALIKETEEEDLAG